MSHKTRRRCLERNHDLLSSEEHYWVKTYFGICQAEDRTIMTLVSRIIRKTKNGTLKILEYAVCGAIRCWTTINRRHVSDFNATPSL